MAKGYYETLYKDVIKKSVTPSSASQPKTTQQSLQSQIENLDTRLTSSGVDTKEDSRNFIEKALNLTPDQNVIFDIFEVLGRPQQAAFGAIDALQNGENVGEAALKGLTGDKDTSGKDILMNTGLFKDNEGKLDLVDSLGFVGDIALDPADLALIPVSGGASIPISLAADAGRVAGKTADVLNTAGKVADAAKTSNKTMKSLSSVAFDAIGKGVKGSTKLADKGIEMGLKALDESKGIKYLTPNSKSAANLGKVVTDGNKVSGALETYKDVKDTVNRAFNSAASIPKKVRDAVNKNNANSVRAAAKLDVIYKDLDKGIKTYADEIASKTGRNVDEVAKEVDNMLLDVKEFKNFNRETTMKDLLKEAQNGKLTRASIDDDTLNKMLSVADDVNLAEKGIKLTIDVDDAGKIVLNDDWKKILNPTKKQINKLVNDYGDDFARTVQSLSLDDGKLGQKVTKLGDYSQEQLDKINQYITLLETDENFAKLYNQADSIFDQANKIVDEEFGTSLASKYNDNAGYVRHAFDNEAFKASQSIGVNPFGRTTIKGATGVLSDRTLNMTVAEANKMFRDTITKNIDNLTADQLKGIEKFEGIFKNGITSSFSDYMANVPKLARDSNLIDEVLLDSTFGISKELKSIDKQILDLKHSDNVDNVKLQELYTKKTEILDNSNMKLLTDKDSTIPKGFKQLNKDEFTSLKNKMMKISKEFGNEAMEKSAKQLTNISESVAINKDVLRIVEVLDNTKEIKGMTRMYDTMLNFYKRNKVTSPTNVLNTMFGNTFNMYVGGISPTKQAQLFPQAMDIMSKHSDVAKKVASGIDLTDSERFIDEIWNGFIDAGFGNPNSISTAALNDLPESLQKYFREGKTFKDMNTLQKATDAIPYAMAKINQSFDEASRLVTYLEGYSNPKFLEKLGVADAGEAVRKINFDARDLTGFEQNVMKRLVPFYTFTKKNLAFQLDNLTKNGEKYHRALKAYDGLLEAATGGNDEDTQTWLKNNLYIPIPSLGENGEYKVIRATLPLGQLVDMTDDTMGGIANTLTPLVKLPIEKTTGVNTFNGLPISNFEGEMSKDLPFLTKDMEHTLGSLTGLDVPFKNISKIARGDALDTVTMTQNVDNDKLSKMYDELDRLEQLMNQYEQSTGQELITINELNKANKNNTVDSLMADIKQLNGIKEHPYSSFINK